MRSFAMQSRLNEGNLALALAPALTPEGIDNNPVFFSGFAVYPQVLARGLLVLADVTATRYFKFTPKAQRDPVLSAQGDRLRAECFSACNGVYARLDLLQPGVDGRIGFGTTNVDIGMELRTALTRTRQKDKLHLDIGYEGLAAVRAGIADETKIHLEAPVIERPVQMPDRWIRALGNAAQIHQTMKPVFTLKGAGAQAFVAALPPVTGKNQAGWLTPAGVSARLLPRRSFGAVYISGLHRLSALKRIMTNLLAITFYMPADGEPGPFMAEVELPCARLTLSLTAESWHGYSGEGALLLSLAEPELLEDAESVGSLLAFDAMIDEKRLAAGWKMSEGRVRAALSLLAVSGKLGFDAHDGVYYHRELPDDPDRMLKDNPRLKAAAKLVDKVTKNGERRWLIRSGETDYRVSIPLGGKMGDATCTCTWYLNHQNRRGPCKHMLAVQLKEGGNEY